MKYSLNLLKHFISINDSVENIGNKLTLKTVEVEEITCRKIDRHIVIGKILSVQKHPDADRLSVCMVNCGEKGTFQIICGGENVREGIFVPTALAGAVFEKAGITIEPRKMRGVESNGMICSKGELDISEDLDTHWIWDMEKDLDDLSDDDLGKSIVEKYPWLESAVIDIDNKGLTNRPDLTGHFGLGVELNAMYGDQEISYNGVKTYFDTLKNTNIIELLDNKEKTKIGLKSECDKLNSYILMEINDINVMKSSFFTRLLMLDLGDNPISNWVDFSNLFMNISGQPVHFFDADKVKGNIIIRYAKDGEKFTDLFGKEYDLLATDIVICDDEKILALAGIVGGLNSGVTENTKNILVEIANFDAVCVRKTGIRLGLRTDAELRYEKNISPSFSLYVFLLFLDLLKYYNKDLGAYTLGGLSYYTKNNTLSFYQNHISLDYDKMQKFIFGDNAEGFDDVARNILTRLGFGIDGNEVLVPFWRSPDDITIVQDIYEEIARIYGYENIANVSPKSEVSLPKTSSLVNLYRDLESIFVRDFGFDQVETYPRTDKKSLDIFGVNTTTLHSLKNPIDTDKPFLRNDMDYVMINYITKNYKFFDEFKIFDIGRVRSKNWDTKDSSEKFADKFIGEKLQLSAMYYQKSVSSRDHDSLLSAKSHINTALEKIGLYGVCNYKKTSKLAYHPNKQGEILFDGEKIGFVGTVHPMILKNYKISENADLVYLSLDLQKIDKLLSQKKATIQGYETLQDQIIWRDLCFVIDDDRDYDMVLDPIRQISSIEDVDVFDLYKGDNLPQGKKSIALKIKIKGNNMQTEEINQIMDKAIKVAEKNGAKLRE